jgi:CRP-like cAMP-binding protein
MNARLSERQYRENAPMQYSFIADSKLTQALQKRSIPLPCLKGRMLFRQGETPKGLYMLKNGKASLQMNGENGAEVLHLTVGPGSILGIPAVVTEEPHSLSAMACARAQVDFIGLSDFEDLMKTEPSLFPLVLSVLAAEVRSARLAFTGLMTKLRRSHTPRMLSH